MKITENEVEVEKHQSVIAPLLLLLLLFLFATVGCALLFRHHRQQARLEQEDTG